ncbi:MAG: 3-deoxy-manno-octulosonate cytidylyltransferase [Deltaproteobacteria bacterium]|nr:3-deoxy-manno-octulosonate cytidylyltransferase [Deltaproteobacteria bacterium]
MEVVALIPSRYGSTRFPGKPLALLRGKPMIQHVYEQTCRVRGLARVLVATDDDRIADAVRAIGGEVAMTRADHPTGTDRLAEVARGLTADVIVNVQGDLPFFPPSLVEDAVAALTRAPAAAMATVKTPIHDLAEWQNINVVKVVTDREGYALYFSRSPIPYVRDQMARSQVQSPRSQVSSLKSQPDGQSQTTMLGYRHIGLYVYRRDFLLTFPRLARTPLEQCEQLEQLRALEWGYRIVVSETERPTIEVDTPEDLQRAEEALL